MGHQTHVIYNVTVSVEPDIQAQWLSWMLEVHLRDMLATGCFLGFRFSELSGAEDMGPTYTIQYELAGPEDLERYEKEHAPAMRQKGQALFGTRALAFRTTMRVIAAGSLRDQ
ncbi:MAG: DUF4286 family protein [Flavobacteriales bacterium]